MSEQATSSHKCATNIFLSQLLGSAGLANKCREMKLIWLLMAISGAVFFVVVFSFSMPDLVLVGSTVGLLAGAGSFILLIRQLAARHQANLAKQLPAVVETLTDALRSGSSIEEAFSEVTQTASEPICSEFRLGLTLLQNGDRIESVLADMSSRVKIPNFQMLLQAIVINNTIHGNLTDTMGIVNSAIHEQLELKEYTIRANRFAKTFAIAFGFAPYIVGLSAYLYSPSYYSGPLFTRNYMNYLVLVSLAAWELLGFWVLLQIATPDSERNVFGFRHQKNRSLKISLGCAWNFLGFFAMIGARVKLLKELPHELNLLTICTQTGLSLFDSLVTVNLITGSTCPILHLETSKFITKISKENALAFKIFQEMGSRFRIKELTNLGDALSEESKTKQPADVSIAIQEQLKSILGQLRRQASKEASMVSLKMIPVLLLFMLPLTIGILVAPAMTPIIITLSR